MKTIRDILEIKYHIETLTIHDLTNIELIAYIDFELGCATFGE